MTRQPTACPTAPGERLDWFTHDILPDGSQIMAIRPESPDCADKRAILGAEDSRLLHALLNALACDIDIPFGPARQAVLRAFFAVKRGRANVMHE